MASKSLIRGNVFNERKTMLLFKGRGDAAGSSAGGGNCKPTSGIFGFRDYGFSNMLGTVARTLSWDSLWLWKGSVTML